MRAGYIDAVKSACFRDDMPEPKIEKSDDVKIRIHKCGICGSEVHAYHGVHPFRIPPLVSGHEYAGEVVEIGSAVKKIKVGDRVTGEPQYGCGDCWYCRHGMYNLCTSRKVLGSGGWSGALGEYIVTPERTVVPLDDKLSYEEGALIEPVANGMYAVRHAGVDDNSTICIIGAGPIGIGDLLCAQLYHAKKIIITDIVDFNLKKAREMGAEYTVNNRTENLYNYVMELTDGLGVDMTFLAFGDGPTLQQAAEITRRDGKMIQHAMMTDGLPFPYEVHQQHQLEFKAYQMYVYEDFEILCKAIADGKLNLSHFVSQRYPIEQFKEAMIMADERPEPVLKVMTSFD